MVEVCNFDFEQIRDLLKSVKETSPLQSDRWEAMRLLGQLKEVS